MPVIRTYRCPDCGNTHEQLLMHSEDEPDPCPSCGNQEAPFIQLPSQAKLGGSPIGRAGDSAYNELEAASLVRAQMAEQQMMAAGVPQDQARRAANELKITNLRDNTRVGEVGAMPPPPNNIVTQTATEIQKMSGAAHPFFQGNIAAELARTKEGAERTTGATALQAIQGGRGKW